MRTNIDELAESYKQGILVENEIWITKITNKIEELNNKIEECGLLSSIFISQKEVLKEILKESKFE